MMTEPAIAVRNLSKRYHLGVISRKTLQDEVRYWWYKMRGKDPLRHMGSIAQARREQTGNAQFRKGASEPAEGEDQSVSHPADPHSFWALRDVSFNIQPGEIVGIIGRNGAGKSTLLKILSRITEPTEGEAIIKGRVASLLEIGTGFHPELTGRENIYMNGTILGMRKAEIDRKFDEIAAFAEIDEFLDTPVKRYSSGMYVRLAFAVAAHLEPEILLIDEVLAVGDEQFQKKCLGKMESVGKEGRTVLFVSHNMGSIAQLCQKTILLSHGEISLIGKTPEIIERYLDEGSNRNQEGFSVPEDSHKKIYFSDIRTLSAEGKYTNNFKHNESITVSIQCRINEWVSNAEMGFYVTDQRGRKVFTSNNPQWRYADPGCDRICTTVVIPGNILTPGKYFMTFAVHLPRIEYIDLVSDAVGITIIDGGSAFASEEGRDYGCVFVECQWKLGALSNMQMAGSRTTP
jgi:lipopolysaccharide transport system ATP-binding protein